MNFHSALIGKCVQRNNAGFSAPGLRKPMDVYKAWLKYKGGTGRSLRELEYSFARANGGTGRAYSEVMGTFLTSKGFTTGTLEDRWRQFLNSGIV